LANTGAPLAIANRSTSLPISIACILVTAIPGAPGE
jgi:hypothetical protein